MVEVIFDSLFEKKLKKIKDNLVKLQIKKQIEKIIINPEIGKPMMYNRKGTREVYIKPFRLSYSYYVLDKIIYFLDIYHKDEQ